jgi:hypothetical protein
MTTRWMAAMLLPAICIPGWGQSQSQARFMLTAGQVAHTISAKGIEITGEQVSLLAKVVATEPNPVLDIVTVAPLGSGRPGKSSETHSLIKIACRVPGICLPFYVIVRWPEKAVGDSTRAPDASSAAGSALLTPNLTVTMRAGARATLVMDDGRSHIQIAVISLESGIVGRRIRVASPDHKQTYVGEVVNASLLRRSY